MEKKRKKYNSVDIISHIVFIFLALCCIVPMVLVVIISLSSSESITSIGYTLFPKEWSLGAYQFLMKDLSSLINAYGVTFLITITGTVGALVISSMLAYALSRKQYKLRTVFNFIVFFTMIFSAGLIPQYIVYTRYYHLADSLWAVMLPSLVSGWNVILLRTFFMDLPEEVLESGEIDGCNEFKLLWKIAMPMMKPALATVGLMVALGLWNEWYRTMIYINSSDKFTLQYLLYRILKNAEELMKDSQAGLGMGAIDYVSDTAKMAMAVLAAGPMMFVFPFFQKYFVRGISAGAVKG